MAIGTQASVHCIEDVLISEVSAVRGSTVQYDQNYVTNVSIKHFIVTATVSPCTYINCWPGSSIPSGRELSKNVKSLDERLKAVYDVVVEREARLREGVNVGGVESEDTLSLEKYQQLLM